MKNGIALSIVVVAFVAGSFLPYFHLNGKIEETNSKMDKIMENLKTYSDKINYFRAVDDLEKDANALQENDSDISDQKLNERR